MTGVLSSPRNRGSSRRPRPAFAASCGPRSSARGAVKQSRSRKRAISSAVEHSLHTGGAASSIPASPTIQSEQTDTVSRSATSTPPQKPSQFRSDSAACRGLRTEFRPFSRVLRLKSPASLSPQNSVSRCEHSISPSSTPTGVCSASPPPRPICNASSRSPHLRFIRW